MPSGKCGVFAMFGLKRQTIKANPNVAERKLTSVKQENVLESRSKNILLPEVINFLFNL